MAWYDVESEAEMKQRRTAAFLRAELASLRSSHPTPLSTRHAPSRALLRALKDPDLVPTQQASQEASSSTLARESKLNELDTRLLRYRMTGTSVFFVELERGVRARKEFKSKGKQRESLDGDDASSSGGWIRKGVVVRFETFCHDAYHEPYYVVLAPPKPSSIYDTTPSANEGSNGTLEIVHHTIPRFLPLRLLARKYLGIKIREEVSGADADEMDEEDEPPRQPDLDFFVAHLHRLLDAFVHRREALHALRKLHATTSDSAERRRRDFRVFASEAADRVAIEWNLDVPPSENEDEEEEDAKERIIVLQLAFEDLLATRIGRSDEERKGGEALVRYVERSSISGRKPVQVVLPELRSLREGPSSIERVVQAWWDETTREGWKPTV